MDDVCIVGAGPAGLATALALRQHNFRVTTVDCAVPSIDKACGEGLMPGSLAALRALGVEIPDSGCYPFRGIRFVDGSVSVAADFTAGPGFGLRRIRLHSLLVEAAARAKVNMIWNAKHVQLCPKGVWINGGLLPARWVVGADGHNSSIRKAAGLGAVHSESRRRGFRRHYRIRPWSDYVELYWGPRGQIYVTPVAADEVNVAFMSKIPRLRLDDGLADFPQLAKRLAGAAPSSDEMGALSVSRRLHQVCAGAVALVGDASGSVDAMTGEGMCLAFQQARALAGVLAQSGQLADYPQKHRAIGAKPQMMAALLLALERYPGVRRRVMTGLARNPRVFESLLHFHVGASSIFSLASPRLLGFGLDCLAA